MNPLVMPVLSHLFDLFRRRRFMRETVLPLVATADGQATLSHAERRQAVLSALMDRGLSEGEARLLLESGLSLYRRLQAKAAKKAARRARREAEGLPGGPAALHRPDLPEPPE